MALRESESLLDNIPDGVLTVDVTTKTIQSVNDTCCTMLHREESTLVGLPFGELAADERTPITDEAVGQARKNGPVTVQWRVRTGQGTALPVEARVTVTTRGGQELAILTLRERPQREAARQPLERGRDRYRTLFDNDDLVLWEQDFSEARAYAMELAETGEELGAYLDDNPEELFEILGRMEVHMVNEAALDFYGVESKEELVANFDEMMVPGTREGLTAMWQAVVDGERYFCTECKFQPLDGDAWTPSSTSIRTIGTMFGTLSRRCLPTPRRASGSSTVCGRRTTPIGGSRREAGTTSRTRLSAA